MTRLANQASSYLRRHVEDPVDWYPWGAEAWARAVAEDKPVLVSIGEANSHWCQVMGRESYADPAIAEPLNRSFVCVLVDREERPDLDALYLDALQALTGGGGWPMTLFLTPERKLFFGGTYFPPTAKDDLPSFRSVIESVAEEWRDSRRSLEQQAAEVLRQIEGRDTGLPPRGALGRDLLDAGIRAVVSSVDQVHGGFGEAPRFPQPWLVELALRAAARGPGGAHGAADLTLRRMARGGIYDQVGGGFHHSTDDPAWAVPHYEKLLCDNAGLLRLYTHAWQARHDPLFSRIATECAEYLLTRLRDPSGAFIAGEGAESGGVDGALYRWTGAALAQVSAEAAAFYGQALTGDDAGALTASGDAPPPEVRAALAAGRAGREPPEPDTMLITSWNGQAIAALADAGAALDRRDLVAAAEAAAAFLLATMATNDGRLVHAWHGGTATGDGLLEDYAYLAEGLLALWEATFDARWARAAEELVRRMVEKFWDAEAGGLWSTPRDGERLVVARKDLVDATTPSPNGVASLVLQRLGVLLGDEALARLGVEILEAAQPLMQAFPQECGTLLAALDFHLSVTREIAVVGDPASPDTVALLREVRTRFLPNRVLAGGTGLASPLLEGREPIDGRATAYVCEHNVCKRPTTDPDELARQLRTSGTPAPETVNRAAELARFTLHRMTLLDRLDNPLWIGPLLERGFFATPPAPIDSYVPGALGAPPWPDSRYLAKMAGVDPFAVHRVAMAIPETANSLVHEDLADAALALPPDLAADFAGRAEGWLATSAYHVMLPKKLGELVSHLAKKGRGDAAVRLAGALLELFADTEGVEQGRDPGPDGFAQAPQPRARYGAWDYEQILKENVPDLVDAVRLPALVLLCDLLDRALTLSLPAAAAPAGGADGSFLWRPAVEDDPRNLDRSLRNALVSAVRDAAERIARAQPGAVVEVVAELFRRPWAVFRRLALQVVRLLPADAPSLVAELLGERQLLTDPHTSREYVLLGRERWAQLPAEVREQILGWVEEGPDLALWDAVPERWATDPADRLGAEEYALAWSEVRRELLAEAHASLDEAFAFELNDPPVDLATPKQAAWLRSAGPEAVARFASTWREPGLIGAPTAGGLWRKLVEVVTTEPAGFAEGALQLAPLPDDGLRAVAIGLREAAKQSTKFEWGSVVELFAGAVARADAAPEMLMAVARCLAAGFEHGDAEIPASLREHVWDVLAPLVGPGSDPTVAAEGLHAVLRYALWVRRRLEGSSGRASPSAPVGWDGMPEVRTALEALLGLDRDRTVVVHSVLGQWFPWLVMLDPEWAVRRRGDVFPAQPELEHLRRAAWDTYLSVAPVYDQVFALLADEYGDAERDLSPDDPLTRPRQGLAEHLVALYLRGRLALDGDSLLTGFFERASPQQRAHALAWVGQMLQRQTDRTPTPILQRLEQLWERRVAVARAAPDPSVYAEELAQFGSWFVSGRFSASWAAPRLLELLTLTGRVTNTTKVVEALKEHMETMPWDVVQIVAILVANEADSITIIGWGQNAQQILSRIVGGSDARARDLALDLLDTFDLQPVAELVRWS